MSQWLQTAAEDTLSWKLRLVRGTIWRSPEQTDEQSYRGLIAGLSVERIELTPSDRAL